MQQDTLWHAEKIKTVIHALKSNQQQGLSFEEAEARLDQYGPNQLETLQKRSLWQLFFRQFNNVIIYVLIGAATLAFLLQEWTDGSVILGVVIINAVIGFWQENRAENALQAIHHLLAPEAQVIRDGKRQMISADALVPGDIVILQAGDRVPADCRLLNITNLQIQEAILTGESHPVIKTDKPAAKTAGLSERTSMAYAGTLVTRGRALAIIVATGVTTEIGRIGKLLFETKRVETPLLRKMRRFAKVLTFGILIAAICLLLLGIFWRQYPLNEMFLAAVAFAVAAVPEGLPPVLTITLAIGVMAMARVRAIVRRLPAVESLGSVTVICIDKTGTLTRNEMMVTSIEIAENRYHVTGSGYIPAGHIETKDQAPLHVDDYPDELETAIRAGVCCNEAELHQKEDDWKLVGDPTEGALLTLGLKAKQDWQRLRQESPMLDSLPFSSDSKYMASLHKTDDKTIIYVKGAPEVILKLCDTQQAQGKNQALNRDEWLSKANSLAEAGLRVLAVAIKKVDHDQKMLDPDELDGHFTCLALFGLIDAPRVEAKTSVDECRTAGIQVKMITGDHAATAKAIAEKVGIDTDAGVILGDDIDELDDHALMPVVKRCHIFARTTPIHKLRLVKALQAEKQIVAMTGDGVNDAPALKKADIGIAMGHKGTEAAKEAAEIVLTDDNFATIVQAVKQGRTIYSNLLKSIFYLIPTSVGEALAILIAILFGTVLPITPLQILWINMVTAITLGISLAFEKEESGIMQKPPRNPAQPIFRPFLIWRIFFVGILMVIGAYGLFWWQKMHGALLTQARGVAVNAIVMYEIVYLINSRNLHDSTFHWRGWFGNSKCLLAIIMVIFFQLALTYWPILQSIFGLSAITGQQWLMIIFSAIGLYLFVELEKFLSRNIQSKMQTANSNNLH